MTGDDKRNPLIAEEDWWTVWFGLVILLVATVLGILALSDRAAPLKVPKLGKWVSNPTDVFYKAKSTRIDVAASTTLSALAERINAQRAGATAEIEPVEDGVRLRVASSRDGERQTISFKTLLAGGDRPLHFRRERPDSAGMGARAYVSESVPSADTIVGKGNVTITAERSARIGPSLAVSAIGILILTAIGVRVMGQRTGR